MSGHVLELRGCTPEPLGNYLKALGVFRLVGEQADPQARAWWKNGFLHVLQSKWNTSESTGAESQLADWLLKECHFTPLIAPWQKGTGYLPIGKRDVGGVALKDLLKAKHPGTEYFREVFRDFAASLGINLGDDSSQWLEAMKQANADLSDAYLLRALRNRVHSPNALKWLDSVGISASRSRDLDSPWWFPILGSGGGEASGQYIVNHQQRLKAALLDDQDQSRFRLEASLVDNNQIGTLEANSMGAMYYPSLMKVPNAGQDFLPNPQRRVNPWDFILLLEGSLVWSMAVTRRTAVTSERASFPFYCRSSFGGSMTIAPKEVEGAEKSIAHGELWCPTWSRPSTLAETQRIFGEGRIQVGEKVCSRSLDFALAMMGLGVDRGIQAFHRYLLLERSGSGRQTTLLAVPNGSFVLDQTRGLSLLTELREFAESVATNLTDNGQQPRRLMLARIDFERAWFDATTSMVSGHQEACSQPLLDVIVTVGRLMRELGANSGKPGVVKIKKGEKTSERLISPVDNLGRQWADIIGQSDSSSEYCLARAIAGITAWGEVSSDGRKYPAVGSVRSNLLAVVRPWKSWEWYDAKRHRGFRDTSVWSPGVPLQVNMAAVLRRRLIDAQRGVGEGLPLWSPDGASFDDLLAFWNGEVDELRLAELIHGLALINPGHWNALRIEERQARDETPYIDTSDIWFDADDKPRIDFTLPRWLTSDEFVAATELPRAYHMLKLCFVGGRLPRRPVEGQTPRRTGDEPFPPKCLDVLALLEAGRLPEAVWQAAGRLRAKGYPAVVRDTDIPALDMDQAQCRRLAGLLLIPVRRPGVLAALAIKPETST